MRLAAGLWTGYLTAAVNRIPLTAAVNRIPLTTAVNRIPLTAAVNRIPLTAAGGPSTGYLWQLQEAPQQDTSDSCRRPLNRIPLTAAGGPSTGYLWQLQEAPQQDTSDSYCLLSSEPFFPSLAKGNSLLIPHTQKEIVIFLPDYELHQIW